MKTLILAAGVLVVGMPRGFHAPHALRPDGGMITDAGSRRTPPYKDAYRPKAVADRIYFDDLTDSATGPTAQIVGWGGPVVFPASMETYAIVFWPRLDAGYEDGGVYLPNATRCGAADGGYFCRRPL